MQGTQFKIQELFEFAPGDFRFEVSKLRWESPCWVGTDLHLACTSRDTQLKFGPELNLPLVLDALAKETLEQQSWNLFGQSFSNIQGSFANDWWRDLYSWYGILKNRLKETASLFPAPARLAARGEFAQVNLPTIMAATPDSLSIYLANEKGAYRRFGYLRMHSSPVVTETAELRWFEKRLPDDLHSEDIVPWLRSTIERLPLKQRPKDISAWTQRLLAFEPQLSIPATHTNAPWSQKPKIIVVFGAVGKIGYRSMFHVERRDIVRLVRLNEVILLSGKIRQPFTNGMNLEKDVTLYFFGLDEPAACRVERQLMAGAQIHFGLDGNILGLACRTDTYLHAINVPLESIRRLGIISQQKELRLASFPHEKHKRFEIIRRADQSEVPTALPLPSSIPQFGAEVSGEEYVLRPEIYGVLCLPDLVAVVSTPLGAYLPGGEPTTGESDEEALSRTIAEKCSLRIRITQRLGIADELEFSGEEQRYFRKRCTFFLADVIGNADTHGRKTDSQPRWMSYYDAHARLVRSSQKWAVDVARCTTRI